MNISVDIGGDLRPIQEEQWECELYPMFRPQSPWVKQALIFKLEQMMVLWDLGWHCIVLVNGEQRPTIMGTSMLTIGVMLKTVQHTMLMQKLFTTWVCSSV